MRVGLDVDEVVAQLHQTWLDRHNRKYGMQLKLEQLTKWDDYGIATMMELLVPDLYDEVIPYPKTQQAVEGLRYLGHEIIYVTSCGVDNVMAPAKEEWLKRYNFLEMGQGLHSGHIIAGHDKRNAPVDVLVDDYLPNVSSFRGWSVLQNRVHNLRLTTNKQRITHLSDFVEILRARAA